MLLYVEEEMYAAYPPKQTVTLQVLSSEFCISNEQSKKKDMPDMTGSSLFDGQCQVTIEEDFAGSCVFGHFHRSRYR